MWVDIFPGFSVNAREHHEDGAHSVGITSLQLLPAPQWCQMRTNVGGPLLARLKAEGFHECSYERIKLVAMREYVSNGS